MLTDTALGPAVTKTSSNFHTTSEETFLQLMSDIKQVFLTRSSHSVDFCLFLFEPRGKGVKHQTWWGISFLDQGLRVRRCAVL